MEETAKKTEAFLAAIKALSEQECAEIEAEIASVRKARLESMEAEAQQHYKAYAEYEVARIHADANRDISEKNAEARKNLTQLRASLCARVFESAREQLCEFRATPQYRALLCDSVRRAAEVLSGEAATLFVCKADEGLADELKAAYGAPCGVQTADDIALGGVRVCAGTYLIDDTLDKRLASQKAWFLENSGLSVEE